MSIASEIENISNHLTNAYNSLENIGVSTEGINKNINNLSSQIESVYNDLPKTEAVEGTLLNIQQCKKGKLSTILKGNTSQQTYTGKNLFNFIGITDTSGVANLNDKIININWSAGFNLDLNDPVSTLDENKTYTISFKHKGDALYLRNKSVDATDILQTDTDTNYKTYSLTLTNITGFQFRFIRKTSSGSASIKDFQIEENSTATDYEPYCGNTVSPNPNYPQDVQTVGGNNKITISGKNIFDKNNAEIIRGTVQSTYFAYQPNSYNRTLYLSCLPNTTYTIQKRNDGDTNRFAVASGYKEIDQSYNDAETSVTTATLSNDSSDITITTGVNDTYLLILYYRTAETLLTEQQVLDSIQVEVGSTKTTYENYTSQEYSLNLPVENLAIPCDGLWFGGTNNTFYNQSQGYGFKASVLPKTTYTISKKNAGNRFSVILSENEVANNNQYRQILIQESDGNRTTYTFTTGANDKYVWFGCYRGTDSAAQQSACEEVQIEKGSKINRYTPYGTTPIELYKINNLQDYFYYNENKWYWHKENNKITLSKNITLWSLVNNCLQSKSAMPENIISIDENTYCYSNYFKYHYYAAGITGVIKHGEIGWNSSKKLTIKIENMTSLQDYIDWMNIHPINLYYQLDNPINIEITDTILINQLNIIKNAMSYNNQTNISQTNNNLPFIINASALLKNSN